MPRVVKVAAVQPRSHFAAGEPANVEEALGHLDRCALLGADLVVFPEGYPGPTNPRNDYHALTRVRAKAREHRLHVVAGAIEPASERGRHHIALYLIGDDGDVLGVHHRVCPVGPYIYPDSELWEFDYLGADRAPQVIETRLGRIGMLVCSEAYVPELARLLMIQGADMIALPAGGALNELLDGWRALIRARAIENVVYTIATQNLYYDRERGIGMIASPERVLTSSTEPGILLADLDLDRLEYLRTAQPAITFPKPYDTTPGVQDWRRPELFGELLRPVSERTAQTA
jgi:predicted amidohydrolase